MLELGAFALAYQVYYNKDNRRASECCVVMLRSVMCDASSHATCSPQPFSGVEKINNYHNPPTIPPQLLYNYLTITPAQTYNYLTSKGKRHTFTPQLPNNYPATTHPFNGLLLMF